MCSKAAVQSMVTTAAEKIFSFYNTISRYGGQNCMKLEFKQTNPN